MNVTYTVFRFDPSKDKESRYEAYQVPVREGMTVLDGLLYILDNVDPTLSFRFACREGVCGSCAMFINGSYRLACQTQIKDLKSDRIKIEPLPNFQVIKDLVVDLAVFFEKLEKAMPYLVAAGALPEKERLQSMEQRKQINEVIDCILCAACQSACPQAWTNKDFLGPAVLTKAYRFVGDSRDGAQRERLKLVAGEDGVWRCHSVFNCVEACPKKINQTVAISRLKRKAFVQKLKFWQRDGATNGRKVG
ncbi:MAG: succinate dehydrogenase iron-sulfur subunit [Chloroflexi bacterium]|nr:succinate dehydrogenase iron-sulfur subunit [Chloroflexota bacterium]